MITYRENRNDIIQRVEIDLTEIPAQSRGDLESKITKYLKYKDKSIFRFDAGNKLIYETEVLIPKVNKNRLNILMVLGNPAVHSVAEGMFFSYEKTPTQGKWREHRFWRALREYEILRFHKNVEEPTPENNEYKREHLLNGEYESYFNIFILPYFSFPTPASTRECDGVDYSGVPGIRKIVGKEIFEKMKECEFKRFKGIVSSDDIKNVICFQKTNVLKEILKRTKSEQIKSILSDSHHPVYKLGDALKHVTLYYAGSTKSILTDEGKKILRGVVSDIRTKNRIG